MLTTGPNLGLLDNGNYGEGTYHELLRLFRGLDALVQPHVKSAATATPPGSPVEGDCYIIPANPTGAWAGQTGKIARWTARSAAGNPVGTPSWEFYTPKKGWLMGVDDTGGHLKHNGTTWYDYTDDAAAATLASEQAAAASAAAALVSENNAADSETAAAASAAAALVSENNAADSETAAAASQTAAASSQTASAASASAAAASATSAGNSATTATTQATTATTQATTATTKASEASASASAAATSATAAAGSATTATTQAGVATTKANEAASSAAALAASLEAFRTQSLGTFASDPTVDGNGDPLQEGAEYFNSVTDTLRIYVNGQWQDYDYSAQQSTAAASLSASNAAASAGTATAQANIATTQAGNAASSASAASTSAGTASAQAAIATTQAETATTKAGEAAASQSAAATSATNASNSASTATTQATNASNSASAAATSATAAAGSATTATTQAGTATSQASSAAGSATAAAASATTATNQAAAAAASALSAASVVSQDLSAIDRTVFAGTLVDAFIYDTSKDSDGGAWRKRCSHTSWENETLSGNWLGSAANETAARLISGATTGSYYYDTTALWFYTLNAGSGKTATYRGNVRQFPAKVLITAEATRVVLWDLTQAGAPMWMVFVLAAGGTSTVLGRNVEVITSVSAVNGLLAIGRTTAGEAGLLAIDFLSDSARRYGAVVGANGLRTFAGNLAARNTAAGFVATNDSVAIVDFTVNDVAMTVLPSAPVDVATGLPIPTIAVATAGGVSVITDSGSVWDITATSYGIAGKVMFRDDNKLAFTLDVLTTAQRHLHVYAIPSADVSTGAPGYQKGAALEFYSNDPSWSPDLVAAPAYSSSTVYRVAEHALGTDVGMAMLHENPASPTDGMVAYVTKDYSSGWLPGDIRGAWLADTVAETKTGGTDTDRSVKANNLTVNGSLTKAAVASGAALMGYSGFSAANYLEQPYNSDLDFGTGGFCIMGWAKFAATAAKEVIFCRDSPTTGKLIRLQVDVTTSYLSASAYDGTTTRTATGAAAIDDATWKHVLLTYSAGTLTIYVNGVSYATATGAALLTLNNATAVCNIGVDSQHANPATNGTLALWRAGATVPSAEQIKHIYETEKALFQASAQCCLAGTSSAVTALAYDDETDLLHVGTSYGRSAFKGLVRVSSEATPVGAITALAASAGVVVQGGASGVDVYVPAYTLREELLRDAEQMAKFGQNLIAHDFTATASQTTFTLPVGWEIVAVYQQGAIKRETTAWSKSFDGFKWSVVLVTGATVSDWVSILAKRVN